MSKQRTHNEYFQRLVKHKCPTCKAGSKAHPVAVFAWGEYVNAKWRTVLHFCRSCFKEQVIDRLKSHADDCGCTIVFRSRSGHMIPAFLQLVIKPSCHQKITPPTISN